MLEKTIEVKLRTAIKQLGGLCLKFESPGFTGVPDRIILLPGGHVCFAELKQPGKKERKRQVLVQDILRKMGFTVYSTVDNVDKIQDIVDKCREVIQHEGSL